MRFSPWFMLIIVLLGMALTVGAAAFTYLNVRQIVSESPVELPAPPQMGGQNGVPATVAPLFKPTTTDTPTSVPGSAATQAATSANLTPTVSALDPTRITILLLGTDQRHGETDPARTDTIMLLSIDPVRKTAAMLSIPRDIYIPIPGYKVADRINNANAIGETTKYPGGGPALTVKTIQSLVGVPIQRYVMINFDVFTTVMDAIGPIQVCPTDHIHDDKYPDGSYGIITVDFPAGCQMVDSTKALEYSRVRHNAGDDFGRAQRQQEVIRAVREKVLSLGGVSALLGKASTIWASIKDNIKTDMTLDEIIQLALFAQTIPKENIQSAVITEQGGYLLPATLPDGNQVLSPIYEKIQELVGNMLDAAPGGVATNSEATGEGAKILVSNGAGVDGMAKNIAGQLQAKGFIVVDAKNADLPGGYGKTIIRVFTGKVKTARYLAQSLGLDATAITPEKNGAPGVDIELVVGKDLVSSIATASP